MHKFVDYLVMLVAIAIGIAAIKLASGASLGRWKNSIAQTINGILQMA